MFLPSQITLYNQRGGAAHLGKAAPSDQDNDGTPDALDVFPQDANEAADWDCDGVGDNTDQDDDNAYAWNMLLRRSLQEHVDALSRWPS